MLDLAAAAGEIDLKYRRCFFLYFCIWSQLGYTYYPVGEQKCLEQSKRRSRRLSILALLQPLISFVYSLVVGTVSSESYIRMMEQEALARCNCWAHQGNSAVLSIRYIDAPQVQQHWSSWESQGLYIFFLPKYCSEMNPIKLEWQQLRTHELSGQMFDEELDLAYAVIDGIEIRGQRANYTTQHFKFNF